jgi:hypothetical protein
MSFTTIIAKTHVFNKETKKASAAEMQGYVSWSLTSLSSVVSLENQLAVAMAVCVPTGLLLSLRSSRYIRTNMNTLDPDYHSQPLHCLRRRTNHCSNIAFSLREHYYLELKIRPIARPRLAGINVEG